jgi:hypothetical protein
MSKENEVAVGCVSGASVMYHKIYVGYERPSKWFNFLKARSSNQITTPKGSRGQTTYLSHDVN